MSAIPNAMVPLVGDDVAPPPADPSPAVDRLNGLLRGEIAAVETYGHVLDAMAAAGHAAHAAHADTLTAMRADHGTSAGLIRDRVVALGGAPAESSGLYGLWTHAVQGALSWFGGDVGGLRALHEAEEHGLRDYQDALNAVDAASAQLVQDRLVPLQEKHLATLARLLAE